MSTSRSSCPRFSSIDRHSPVPTLSPTASPTVSSQAIKRKRDHDYSINSNAIKVPKHKRAKKAKHDDSVELDVHSGLNLSIAKMDSQLLADFVAQKTKRQLPNLSLVELEDLHIPAKAFLDATGWDEPRNLSNMPYFLDRYSSRSGTNKTLSMASKSGGCPHTLVITSAGLRAANITRALRTFQTKDAVVAKLFAKHIKLKDAIEYVKKTRMGIGVGTPSRVIDLLDVGALSLEKLERVIVDGSYIDQKKRGIFDMGETQQPLMQLLNRPVLKSRYAIDTNDGDVQLILY